MTLGEAVKILERRMAIKARLANAPRTSAYSRRIADEHRREATAIALVLAALSDPTPAQS